MVDRWWFDQLVVGQPVVRWSVQFSQIRWMVSGSQCQVGSDGDGQVPIAVSVRMMVKYDRTLS